MPLHRADPRAFPFDDAAHHAADHSGARWMVAVALCLVMLGLACTF